MQGVDDEHRLEAMVDAGRAIVGSPEDASNAIKDLEGRSGGFGTFLAYAVNWAPWEATKRSYELLATEVAPQLNSNTQRGMESVNRRAARMPT
jgi:limonene 1,2-monooxygenase